VQPAGQAAAEAAELLELRQLDGQRPAEDDLGRAVADGRRAARQALAVDRVDPQHEQDPAAAELGQLQDRRVAAVAAVPVGLAVDLDRVVQLRQAGRGQHHVGGELVLAEDAASAGADPGGGDQTASGCVRAGRRSRRARPGARAAG
jgi:hypothetical protein